MNDQPVDLNVIYQAALAGIHRAYVFMRIGAQGVSVGHFEDTELKGRHQILVVPEPISPEVFCDFMLQFRTWVVGNGLQELVEAYSQFLDDVYAIGLNIMSPPDIARRNRTFVRTSLREKIQTLRTEMNIDGGFSDYFESFTTVRNALVHGTGVVRQRDCPDGKELALTWRAPEIYFVASDGIRYRIGDEPEGTALCEPLETITVDRERRWKIGERIKLSPIDLAEICFMANHDAIDVLEVLRDFGAKHGINMIGAKIVRGGL